MDMTTNCKWFTKKFLNLRTYGTFFYRDPIGKKDFGLKIRHLKSLKVWVGQTKSKILCQMYIININYTYE